MNNLKRFCLIFCVTMAAILYSLPPVLAQDTPGIDVTTAFFKANEAYNTGKFKEAASLYEAAIEKTENGYLYYNLGNCYFKTGELGQALLNYRRAQKLTPRFEDLLSNLNYARQETKDKIEAKGYSQALRKVFFWYYMFSKKELIIAFVALNFAFFLVAGIRLYTKADAVKWILVIVSILYLISGASALTRIYQDSYGKEGVVTAQEVSVRSGNAVNNVVLFMLHEGAEFKARKIKGDWLKIELADGKKGWIQSMGAEII